MELVLRSHIYRGTGCSQGQESQCKASSLVVSDEGLSTKSRQPSKQTTCYVRQLKQSLANKLTALARLDDEIIELTEIGLDDEVEKAELERN